MSSPQISVIIPVYNVEPYLRQCLDSILAQTFTDFDVLLVDDGSTDKSGELCDKYALKDSRIKVVHRENAGVSAARNLGITSAKGRYIVFVDADDYVDREYIKTLHDNIRQMPGHCMVCISRKDVTEYRKDAVSLVERKTEMTVQDALRIMLQRESFGYVWNGIYDREILLRHNIFFDETMKMWEDRHFNLRYINHVDTVCLLPDTLYNYRILKGSAAHDVKDWEAFVSSIVACHKEMMPYLHDRQISDTEYSEVLKQFRYWVYYVHSHSCGSRFTRQYKDYVYDTYVKYQHESPHTVVIHNPHNRLLNSLHTMLWATKCKPLIKAFLYIAPTKL